MLHISHILQHGEPFVPKLFEMRRCQVCHFLKPGGKMSRTAVVQ